MKNASCECRIDSEMQERISDLRRLWTAYRAGIVFVPDLGGLHEYGLSFDYVAPGTFSGQREGYFRYQLSWGGPSDEFRFYAGPDLSCHRVEYWLLDWFDGAHRILPDANERLMLEIWQWLVECGAADGALKRSA